MEGALTTGMCLDFLRNRQKLLILASQSPRRRELFAKFGIDHLAYAPELDEEALADGISNPADLCRILAEAKCLASYRQVDQLVLNDLWEKSQQITGLDGARLTILSADTIVACDGEVLGKPHDEGEARRMLNCLAGKQHEVLTAASCLSMPWSAVAKGKYRLESFVSACKVNFYPRSDLYDAVVDRYIGSGACYDKAGAYGIQDVTALLIKGIEGDYNTVLGYPIAEVMHRWGDLMA